MGFLALARLGTVGNFVGRIAACAFSLAGTSKRSPTMIRRQTIVAIMTTTAVAFAIATPAQAAAVVALAQVAAAINLERAGGDAQQLQVGRPARP
jgi:hypothetical protein